MVRLCPTSSGTLVVKIVDGSVEITADHTGQ
jgi:hypothetical protein